MSKHSTHTSAPLPIVEYGDNFIPVILVDSLEHTTERPFCWDSTCPCHDNDDAVAQIVAAFDDGLCTSIEAYRICAGQQIC